MISDAAMAARRAFKSGTGFSLARTCTLTGKELRSYFATPLIYVLAGIFVLLGGYYAYSDLIFVVTISFTQDLTQSYWELLFSDLRFCLLLTLPFVTMRTFAEERRLGTLELLYTYPLRDGEILGGKFLASTLILAMLLVLTLPQPIYFYTVHAFAIAPLVAGYLGLLLLGCSFIAFGIFISSLCENQVVAGIGTVALLSFLWSANWNEAAIAHRALGAMRMASLFDQFGAFAKGVIDLYRVTYFVSFIAFFLYLTLRAMEARKWRGGR